MILTALNSFPGNNARLTFEEYELATGLVEKLSDPEFEPEAYTDTHRAQVLSIIQQKAKGPAVAILVDHEVARPSINV